MPESSPQSHSPISSTTPLLQPTNFHSYTRDADRDFQFKPDNEIGGFEQVDDEDRFNSYGPIKKWLIGIMSLEGFRTTRLALQSVGVIYGDLGTSPLYVFSTIFSDTPEPSYDEVLGALSLIFWSLFLIFIAKYVVIVLFADDNGEGGTFALYSLICRYCDIVPRGTHSESDLALTHYDTDEFVYYEPQPGSIPWYSKVKRFINGSKLFQKGLLLVVLFGTSLVMGDGILTPAVSVLSAVEGVQIAFPDMEPYIVPSTVVIIFLLFLSQRLGTNKVAKFFAPVIITWLFSIGAIGAYNISQNPSVLKAVSPYYAYKYFLIRGWSGWESLGGILLCISGVEALFADLGHFNKISIRLSATIMVLPCLLLTYAGQAAMITLEPSLVSNAFWRTVPAAVYWPMLVIATLSAVVASQAMVSAAFSIIHQAMALSCFPKVNIVHTSRKIHGQVFVPEVSWILMVLSMSLVIIFQSSTKLTAAYGLASCMLMFLTTGLISIVMAVVWKLHFIFVLTFFFVFFTIDMAFLSSTLLKLFSGGWIPLAFALVFSTIMNVWRWGSDLKHVLIRDSQVTLESLLYDPVPSSTPTQLPTTDDIIRNSSGLTNTSGWLLKTTTDTQPVARVPGLALFYSEADSNVPAVFSHTLNCFSSVPEVVIFVTVRHIVVPTVLPHERFLLSRLSIRGFYRCIARYGYMDVMEDGNEFVQHLIDQLLDTTHVSLATLKLRESKDPGGGWDGQSTGNITPTLSPKLSKRISTLSATQSLTTEVQFASKAKLSPRQLRIFTLESEIERIRSSVQYGATYVLGKALIQARPESDLIRKVLLNYVFAFLANNDRSFSLKTPLSKTIQVGMPLRL